MVARSVICSCPAQMHIAPGPAHTHPQARARTRTHAHVRTHRHTQTQAQTQAHAQTQICAHTHTTCGLRECRPQPQPRERTPQGADRSKVQVLDGMPGLRDDAFSRHVGLACEINDAPTNVGVLSCSRKCVEVRLYAVASHFCPPWARLWGTRSVGEGLLSRPVNARKHASLTSAFAIAPLGVRCHSGEEE